MCQMTKPVKAVCLSGYTARSHSCQPGNNNWGMTVAPSENPSTLYSQKLVIHWGMIELPSKLQQITPYIWKFITTNHTWGIYKIYICSIPLCKSSSWLLSVIEICLNGEANYKTKQEIESVTENNLLMRN